MQETIDSIHAYFERFIEAIRSSQRDEEQYDVWFSGFRGPGNWKWLRSLRRDENQEEARRVQSELDALQQHKATLKTPIALGRQELLSRSRDGDPHDQLDKAENYLRRVLTWYRQDESYWGGFHDATSDEEAAIVVEQLKASDEAFPLRQTDVDRLIEELRIAESIVLRPYELANIKTQVQDIALSSKQHRVRKIKRTSDEKAAMKLYQDGMKPSDIDAKMMLKGAKCYINGEVEAWSIHVTRRLLTRERARTSKKRAT